VRSLFNPFVVQTWRWPSAKWLCSEPRRRTSAESLATTPTSTWIGRACGASSVAEPGSCPGRVYARKKNRGFVERETVCMSHAHAITNSALEKKDNMIENLGSVFFGPNRIRE
jgi:hypothetical protein